ncbi:MAG: hypothetical protein J2P25_01310 [Nocardiopsaceae bacterium]|nr:hypothetical protein [Nocardiopsaceae bacterium]
MKREGDLEPSEASARKETRLGATVLTAKEHTELPAGAKIQLRPLIRLQPPGLDGVITGIEVSGRTPSPFGRSMGDHTVSWQVLVDAVHARLSGRKLGDADGAIATLGMAQQEVSAWMSQPDSAGMLLLDDLEDAPRRRPLLEDAAWRTEKALELAAGELGKGLADKAVAHLSRAMACHLAYLNYLPFATVPAKSERGSHGSGEGTKRGVLVVWERKRLSEIAELADELAMEEDHGRREEAEKKAWADAASRAGHVPERLWGLFDFDAALRAAHAEYALNPKAGDAAQEDLNDLKGKAEALRGLVSTMDPKAGTLAVDPGKVREIGEAASPKRDSAVPAIAILAYQLGDAARTVADGQAEVRASTRLKVATGAVGDNSNLASGLSAAEQAVKELKVKVSAAPERAARVLSSLLHKHLRSVAAAYPLSVIDGKLLQPSAGKAASGQAEAALRARYPALAGTEEAGRAIGALKTAIEAAFTAAGDTAASPAGNGWVQAAVSQPLVVTWSLTAQSGEQWLRVDGRADAPAGVAGMGSHTTAWVVETLALQRLLAGAASNIAALKAIRGAVIADLGREVMTLDQFLPADQLEGGQPMAVLEAAAEVIAATDPGVKDPGDTGVAVAARSYLQFRNLLPFATVDAGSRGGHGERKDGTLKDTYDRGSLDEAAALVTASLTNKLESGRLAEALTAMGNQLQEEASQAEASKADGAWPKAIREAARASGKRLLARAAEVTALWKDFMPKDRDDTQADGPTRADAEQAARRIHDLRWAEHKRAYAEAHP